MRNSFYIYFFGTLYFEKKNKQKGFQWHYKTLKTITFLKNVLLGPYRYSRLRISYCIER